MKTCKKCDSTFSTTARIDGKKRNLKNRMYCLSCSPFGLHNTSKKELDGKVGNCIKCSKEFHYSRDLGHRRNVCNTCLVNSRRPARKLASVAYKGGCCLTCEYSGCVEALDFHHLDPDVKTDGIARLYLAKPSILQAELDKCVLLCCRCHAEVHAGLISSSRIEELERLRVEKMPTSLSRFLTAEVDGS